MWGEQHRSRNCDGKDAQVTVTDIGAFDDDAPGLSGIVIDAGGRLFA
jgi:hypothetical protein